MKKIRLDAVDSCLSCDSFNVIWWIGIFERAGMYISNQLLETAGFSNVEIDPVMKHLVELTALNRSHNYGNSLITHSKGDVSGIDAQLEYTHTQTVENSFVFSILLKLDSEIAS